jgi:hypothetical protein
MEVEVNLVALIVLLALRVFVGQTNRSIKTGSLGGSLQFDENQSTVVVDSISLNLDL